jgi:hypothetical protein
MGQWRVSTAQHSRSTIQLPCRRLPCLPSETRYAESLAISLTSHGYTSPAARAHVEKDASVHERSVVNPVVETGKGCASFDMVHLKLLTPHVSVSVCGLLANPLPRSMCFSLRLGAIMAAIRFYDSPNIDRSEVCRDNAIGPEIPAIELSSHREDLFHPTCQTALHKLMHNNS